MKELLKYFTYSVIVICIITGCSSKKKPSIIKRGYHNLTAHYNGYFNGKMTMYQGVDQLENNNKDDYENIISVFPYGDESQASSVYPQMDTAIKKASIVIQRHKISKWTDDCYLLIGQCNFYKRDYSEAIDNFQYVITKYKPKIPKKKIYKPFIQRHLRYDAMIGLAHTYINNEKYDEAQSIIDVAVSEEKNIPPLKFNLATAKRLLKPDKKDKKAKKKDEKLQYRFKNRLRGELYATYAHFHITQNYISSARENILKAIPYTKRRITKTRYYYILAQLNERLDNIDEATYFFNKVIKRNPPYEMAFNAKISLAQALERQEGSTKEVEKVLKRMIKDEKNKEFRDLLYYSLANVMLKNGREDEAIEYYKLSVRSSTSNVEQKAKSYLKVADIYYRKKDYKDAKTYYDSTLTVLSADYEDHEQVTTRRDNLSELVIHLETIELQDSLQHLASLSPKERDKIINNIIAKKVEEEEQKLEEEEEQDAQMQSVDPTAKIIAGKGNDLTWYFYNPGALGKGYTDFLSKWGNRELEDNWRRINKGTSAAIGEEDEIEDDYDSGSDSKINEKIAQLYEDRDKYYEKIPLTDGQMQVSNGKLIVAYFECGGIYREVFTNYRAAIGSFRILLKRFPVNTYELEANYNLYRLYDKLSMMDSSDYYKNLIVKKYPESDYAKLILNPNYLKEKNKANYALLNYYEETYYEYKRKNYQKVITRSEKADSLYKANNLKDRFAFLRALSIGKVDTLPKFEHALQGVINTYPNTDVAFKSKELLERIDLLKHTSSASLVVADTSVQHELFNFLPKDDHYYIMAVSDNNVNFDDIKIKFSDYNKSYHSLDDLEIDNHIFNDTTRLLLVKGFPNQKKVMKYIDEMNNKKDLYKEVPENKRWHFCIAKDNYPVLFKKKVMVEYIDFYERLYIQ
ncbi:MAG: tetratricopeptide repeat protein [Bacteroidia bacterium]|nr:tetratricopeptide repeat protein [Bacteroidia bacterium]